MSKKRSTTAKAVDTYLDLMTDWPISWAGMPEDVPVGTELVKNMEPFIRDLHARGLAHSTIRRHLDNTWAIGGEIIREFNYYPEKRQTAAHSLLLDSVCCDEAPLLYGADEMEQNSADATARKLHAFLKKTAS